MQIGLYIHVPFCMAKCAYCDFVSVSGRDDLFEGYGRGVVDELRRRPGLRGDEIAGTFRATTVYMGGGTPSVLPLSIMRDIMATVGAIYSPPEDGEITVEVNPGTVDMSYLTMLRELGINRLSVGVQSFNDVELRMLGRIHDRRQALTTLSEARAAGFENLNLDLIFGLPAQTISDWEASLHQAVVCRPTHVSLYALSVEEGTPLAGQIARGDLPTPDEDQAAEMYELAVAVLALAGYEQYEISNWAYPGYESRHNVHTWLNGPYLGFGPAAHSHINQRRWWNVDDPEEYLARMDGGKSPAAGSETLDAETDMAETMILGLRLVRDGVSVEEFRRRYGRRPAELYGPILDELVNLDLIDVSEERIRLTPRGRLLGNQVFVRFLPG